MKRWLKSRKILLGLGIHSLIKTGKLSGQHTIRRMTISKIDILQEQFQDLLDDLHNSIWIEAQEDYKQKVRDAIEKVLIKDYGFTRNVADDLKKELEV